MFALKLSFITVFSAAYIIVLIMTSTAADALILLDIFIMKSSPQVQPLQALNPAHSYFHRMQILPAHRPRLMLLQALSLLQVLRLLIAQLLLFQLSLEILSALEHLILLNPDPALILDCPALVHLAAMALLQLKVLQELAELELPAVLVQECQELAVMALQGLAVLVLLEPAQMVLPELAELVSQAESAVLLPALREL